MKTKAHLIAAMLCLILTAAGCSHTVSHTKEVKVRNNGTMRTSEETITQNPDGTVTRSESKTDTGR
jgi:hypothetical protein